jgi:hypothetical protein
VIHRDVCWIHQGHHSTKIHRPFQCEGH